MSTNTNCRDNDIYGMCPFMPDHGCHSTCMLLLTATDAETTEADITSGDGCCAFALIASHTASEKHAGGNYLMRQVSYDFTNIFRVDENTVDFEPEE